MFLYLKNKYPLYIKDLHNQVLSSRMETQNKVGNLVIVLSMVATMSFLELHNKKHNLLQFSSLPGGL